MLGPNRSFRLQWPWIQATLPAICDFLDAEVTFGVIVSEVMQVVIGQKVMTI
jgi:hypothetical protein